MRTVLILLTIVHVALPVLAQPATPCSYDACALRLERSTLVAGVQGRPAVRIGMFGADSLEDLMTRSDSALKYSRLFLDGHVNASRWGLFGGGVIVAASILAGTTASPASNERSASVLGLYAVAITSSVVSSIKEMNARTALARAVWWYNRDLQPR